MYWSTSLVLALGEAKRQRQVNFWEFRASLLYIASARAARATAT